MTVDSPSPAPKLSSSSTEQRRPGRRGERIPHPNPKTRGRRPNQPQLLQDNAEISTPSSPREPSPSPGKPAKKKRKTEPTSALILREGIASGRIKREGKAVPDKGRVDHRLPEERNKLLEWAKAYKNRGFLTPSEWKDANRTLPGRGVNNSGIGLTTSAPPTTPQRLESVGNTNWNPSGHTYNGGPLTQAPITPSPRRFADPLGVGQPPPPLTFNWAPPCAPHYQTATIPHAAPGAQASVPGPMASASILPPYQMSTFPQPAPPRQGFAIPGQRGASSWPLPTQMPAIPLPAPPTRHAALPELRRSQGSAIVTVQEVFEHQELNIQYTLAELPPPPNKTYKINELEDLDRDWDDASMAVYLTIRGVGIPLKHWAPIYKKCGSRLYGTKKELWRRWRTVVTAKRDAGNWKMFWDRFGKNGERPSAVKAVEDEIRKWRKECDEEDAAAARAKYTGEAWKENFSYKKTGKLTEIKKVQGIATRYRQLEGRLNLWDKEPANEEGEGADEL